MAGDSGREWGGGRGRLTGSRSPEPLRAARVPGSVRWERGTSRAIRDHSRSGPSRDIGRLCRPRSCTLVSRLVDDEPAAAGPVVDEATGDAELGRDLGQIVGSVPAGFGQLTVAKGDLATQVMWRGSRS